VLSLTYASCNSDLSAACMWTAVYTLTSSDLPSLGLNSTCTTGGPAGLSEVSIDQYGQIIPNQRSPDLLSNTFATLPVNAAPFPIGQCLVPPGPVNGIYRSVKVDSKECSSFFFFF
jgi:hypothetical protein